MNTPPVVAPQPDIPEDALQALAAATLDALGRLWQAGRLYQENGEWKVNRAENANGDGNRSGTASDTAPLCGSPGSLSVGVGEGTTRTLDGGRRVRKRAQRPSIHPKPV